MVRELFRLDGKETLACGVSRLMGLAACMLVSVLFTGCASQSGMESGEAGRSEAATEGSVVIVDAPPLDEEQQALMSSARRALESGDTETARQNLETLRQQRPDVARVYASLALVLQQQGEDDQAVGLYQQAVRMDPRDAMTVNNLALLLSRKGAFREAAGLLREGLSHSPDTAQLHYNLAVISELYLLDLEAALTHYRRYRELDTREDKRVAGWIADLERRLQ